MKPSFLILPVALATLASCSTPTGMTVREYESLTQAKDKTALPANIQLSIEAPGKPSVAMQGHFTKAGKEVHLVSEKEFIYPEEYEPANSGDRNSVTPATPTRFKVTTTGAQADLRTERTGALVQIKGTISVKEFQGFSKMGGELGKPLLDEKGRMITENKVQMPKFATYTTPVQVAVKPGQTCVFEIAHSVKGAKAVVKLGD